MVRRKDSFWEYAVEIENGKFFICKFCEKRFSGSISRIKPHLAGVRGRDIQICSQVSEAIKLKALQEIDTSTKRASSVATSNNTKRAKRVAASNNVIEGESVSGSLSSPMPNLCEGKDKSKVDKQFAKYSILERVCSNAIQLPFFMDLVKDVAEYGLPYEQPSSLTLELQLIPDIKKEVEEYVNNVKKHSVETGCTLMYNKPSFTLADIFAYTTMGVVYMHATKINLRSSCFFEEMISSIMEEIGPTNVVQFIMDDEYKKFTSTMDMLSIKYPRIYHTPCAARGIDLLMRKICHVPFVCNTLKVAELIFLYIYKHKVNVPLRRVHKKEHFISPHFFMLMSLLKVESELQALPNSVATYSSDWGMELNPTEVGELLKCAKFIYNAIHCKEFWRRGKMVAQVMQPLFQALCLVHYDGATTGYLYEMMKRVQDAVEQCCESNQFLYDVITEILKEVRSDIIHPIHAAAALLNPIYMCSEKFEENDEMKNGVNYIQEHLLGVEEKQDFMNQVELYCKKDSNVFRAEALIMLKTSHPVLWWKFYGTHLPILQKYAIRILSQPCSSSSCKQYQFRNSFVDDYVYMVNTVMMEKYKSLEKQMTEPIILDKLGEVSDNGNWDDDWKSYCKKSFYELTFSYEADMIKDQTGSWLDRWPTSHSF